MERKIHRLPLTRKKFARVHEDPLPVDYTYVPKTRLDKWVWDTLQSGKNLKPKEPVYESRQDYTPYNPTPYNPSSSSVYTPYNPSLPSPYTPSSSSVYTPYNPSLPSPYTPGSLSAYTPFNPSLPSPYIPVAPNSLSAYEPSRYTQAAEKKRVQIAEPKEVKKLAPLVRR